MDDEGAEAARSGIAGLLSRHAVLPRPSTPALFGVIFAIQATRVVFFSAGPLTMLSAVSAAAVLALYLALRIAVGRGLKIQVAL